MEAWRMERRGKGKRIGGDGRIIEVITNYLVNSPIPYQFTTNKYPNIFDTHIQVLYKNKYNNLTFFSLMVSLWCDQIPQETQNEKLQYLYTTIEVPDDNFF